MARAERGAEPFTAAFCRVTTFESADRGLEQTLAFSSAYVVRLVSLLAGLLDVHAKPTNTQSINTTMACWRMVILTVIS